MTLEVRNIAKSYPTGVGARTLSECIALQAVEADRHDPAMARLIDNLDLVARGEFPRLKRMCGVDDEDFADMLAELRGYDPKPGSRFGGGGSTPVTPDILIAARAELDAAAIAPRVPSDVVPASAELEELRWFPYPDEIPAT